MADFEIKDLAENTTPDGSDLLVAQSSATDDTEKMTLDTLIDLVGAPFTSITPTITASSVNPSIGNGTSVMYYSAVGKIIKFTVLWAVGTTTNSGTGTYYVNYPVVPHARYNTTGLSFNLSGTFYESTGPEFGIVATARTFNTTKFEVMGFKQGAATIASWNSAFPFGWGNGDYVSFSGWYEAA